MRGRKAGSPVKAITSNDKELLKALCRTGYISKEQAQKYLNINERRLNNLVRSGYIKSSFTVNKDKQIQVYQIDMKGKQYVASNISAINNLYKATSPRHDLKLADKYLKIDIQDRDYWRTEGDIRELYAGQITESMSMPDAIVLEHSAFIDTEIIIKPVEVIEILTDNYKADEINAKLEFIVEILQIPKEEVKFERAK